MSVCTSVSGTPLIISPVSDDSRSPKVSRQASQLFSVESPTVADSETEKTELPPLCPFGSSNHRLPTILPYQNGHHDDEVIFHDNGVVVKETNDSFTTKNNTSSVQSEKMFLCEDISLSLPNASDNLKVPVCKFVLEPP